MILAQIAFNGGSNSLIHGLFLVLIIGICCAIVWWVGQWVLKALSAPAFAVTAWMGLFILVAAVVIINFLLSLAGHPFITY
jgi:hypothetical protein